MQWPFKIIGAASGQYAGIPGCEFAPDIIFNTFPKLQSFWYKTIHDHADDGPVASLKQFSQNLADATLDLLKKQQHFIVLGGDHSCAIGTWSAVAQYYNEFGLIWIDAHMDAHTPSTSPSGNLHGMPVATLLGHGDPMLTQLLSTDAKLRPENITLLGVRSYEEGEKRLLDQLGVKVYYADECEGDDFIKVMAQTIADFKRRGLKFGISFDLDGLDPRDISALGTPVQGGIRLVSYLEAMQALDYSDLIGLEIVEYNPSLDKQQLDIHVVERVLKSFMDVAVHSSDSCYCE